MKKCVIILFLLFFTLSVVFADIYNTQEKKPDWAKYMANVEKEVKKNWKPVKGDISRRVVILFKIGRDGKLLGAKVTESSGSGPVDNAALAAVKSSVFKSLPPEYKDASVDIDFTFDYNVIGKQGYVPVNNTVVDSAKNDAKNSKQDSKQKTFYGEY